MSKEIGDAFQRELAALLNRYSFDTMTNTPDFILAQYLGACLITWQACVAKRDAISEREARQR